LLDDYLDSSLNRKYRLGIMSASYMER